MFIIAMSIFGKLVEFEFLTIVVSVSLVVILVYGIVNGVFVLLSRFLYEKLGLQMEGITKLFIVCAIPTIIFNFFNNASSLVWMLFIDFVSVYFTMIFYKFAKWRLPK